MWTVTNYFLLSLTVSDLLITTIQMIPSFVFMRDREVHIILLPENMLPVSLVTKS